MIIAPTLACCVLSVAAGPTVQEMPEFKPLPQHKVLAKEVGVWKGVMKMYTEPGAPPLEMPVQETNTLMRGGLWLISEFESGPFQGKGQFGYDPVRKKFVGTWIDTTAPYMNIMTGEQDKKTGEMVWYSDGINAETRKPQRTKSVSKFVGEKREFVMYARDAKTNEWTKMFDITYTKVK